MKQNAIEELKNKRFLTLTPNHNPNASINLKKVQLPKGYKADVLMLLARSLKECPVYYRKPKRLAVMVSGGLDSATCLVAAVKALGKKNVEAVRIEHSKFSSGEIEDKKYADFLLQNLGLKVYVIEVDRLLKSVRKLSDEQPDQFLRDILQKEALPRVRALAMQVACSENNWISIDTTNFTELALANRTRGDYSGHIDIFNILLKSEVYQLAKELGVPKYLTEQTKRISEHSLTYEEMLGASYPFLDPVVYYYLEGKTKKQVSRGLGQDPVWVNAIYKKMEQAKFIDNEPVSIIDDFIPRKKNLASWVKNRHKVRWEYGKLHNPLIKRLQTQRKKFMPSLIG